MAIIGHLNDVTRTTVWGWAHDTEHPDEPVALELVDNGEVVMRLLADQYREDLEAVGRGGRCSFKVTVPKGWSAGIEHVIGVRRAADGIDLPDSPRTLPASVTPSVALGGVSRSELAEAVRAIDPAEREQAVRTLIQQADALMRAQGAADAPPPEALDAFYARWRELLPDRPPPMPRRPPEPAPAIRRRALVIGPGLPAPGDPELELVLSEAAALRRVGHEVVLLPADLRPGPGADAARTAGFGVLAAPYTASVEEGLRRNAGLFDAVVVRGAVTALRYGLLIRDHLPRARVAILARGLESAVLDGRAAAEQRPDLLPHAASARRREAMGIVLADAVLASSEEEAASLRRLVAGLQPRLLPPGIEARSRVSLRDRTGAVIPGGAWPEAAVEGTEWFVESVMPRLRESLPGFRLTLAGGTPPDRVRRLLGADVVLAENPPDLDATLARARICLAPWRAGSGLDAVVLAAAARGLPVLGGSVAAQGLALPPERRDGFTDDPAHLAGMVARLCTDDAAWKAQAGGIAVDEGVRVDAVWRAVLRLPVPG